MPQYTPVLSLDGARSKMEDWRRDYNEVRPCSAIGNEAPISLFERLIGAHVGMA
jgi:transposase InsO family protein